MFRNIVVGVDGSQDSEHGCNLASKLALACQSEVTAVNVFDISFTMPSAIGVWSLPIDQQTIDVYRKGELDASERQVNKVFLASKVPFKVIQVAGHAVEGILKTAKSKNADLIVVGSRQIALAQLKLKSIVAWSVLGWEKQNVQDTDCGHRWI